MRLKALSLAAAIAITAAPADAQSIGEQAKTLGEKTGVNAAVGIAPTTMDFVNQAAISDMFQIQAGSLALQRGDPATKALAEQMITDHKKTSEELQGLITGGKVKETLPTTLDSSHQTMLDDLKALQGAEFVKKYRSDMVEEHEAAVSLFQRYAAGGDNPALKDWAGKTLPTLQQHLATARKLD
ncbi:MAG: DUF4142 domain-containing protein [Rhodospirillales bacterium]